jgi:hypothetical protein
MLNPLLNELNVKQTDCCLRYFFWIFLQIAVFTITTAILNRPWISYTPISQTGELDNTVKYTDFLRNVASEIHASSATLTIFSAIEAFLSTELFTQAERQLKHVELDLAIHGLPFASQQLIGSRRLIDLYMLHSPKAHHTYARKINDISFRARKAVLRAQVFPKDHEPWEVGPNEELHLARANLPYLAWYQERLTDQLDLGLGSAFVVQDRLSVGLCCTFLARDQLDLCHGSALLAQDPVGLTCDHEICSLAIALADSTIPLESIPKDGPASSLQVLRNLRQCRKMSRNQPPSSTFPPVQHNFILQHYT